MVLFFFLFFYLAQFDTKSLLTQIAWIECISMILLWYSEIFRTHWSSLQLTWSASHFLCTALFASMCARSSLFCIQFCYSLSHTHKLLSIQFIFFVKCVGYHTLSIEFNSCIIAYFRVCMHGITMKEKQCNDRFVCCWVLLKKKFPLFSLVVFYYLYRFFWFFLIFLNFSFCVYVYCDTITSRYILARDSYCLDFVFYEQQKSRLFFGLLCRCYCLYDCALSTFKRN